jgi:hypothetical protein
MRFICAKTQTPGTRAVDRIPRGLLPWPARTCAASPPSSRPLRAPPKRMLLGADVQAEKINPLDELVRLRPAIGLDPEVRPNRRRPDTYGPSAAGRVRAR